MPICPLTPDPIFKTVIISPSLVLVGEGILWKLCHAAIVSSVASVRATNVSAVLVGLTIREAFVKGSRLGSEKRAATQGVDWKWDCTGEGGGWSMLCLEAEDMLT